MAEHGVEGARRIRPTLPPPSNVPAPAIIARFEALGPPGSHVASLPAGPGGSSALRPFRSFPDGLTHVVTSREGASSSLWLIRSRIVKALEAPCPDQARLRRHAGEVKGIGGGDGRAPPALGTSPRPRWPGLRPKRPPAPVEPPPSRRSATCVARRAPRHSAPHALFRCAKQSETCGASGRGVRRVKQCS